VFRTDALENVFGFLAAKAAQSVEGGSDKAIKGVKKKCVVGIELNLMAVRGFVC
jgi:hypothetical protein